MLSILAFECIIMSRVDEFFGKWKIDLTGNKIRKWILELNEYVIEIEWN